MFTFVHQCLKMFNFMENNKVYPLIFSLKTCIDFTGMSRSTIYNYMKPDNSDRIPYWKKGGRILFDRNEVEKWLRDGEK